MPQNIERQYRDILREYVDYPTEGNLYNGQKFSMELLQRNIDPEEVISYHKSALEEMMPDLPKGVWHSFDLLIEMMIRYGLAHREHQVLVKKQEEFRMEMDLASHVQQTILLTKVPRTETLDIGMISVPAKEMNGDYVYFLENEGFVGVAVADVIGKGIPAALCMSMVKSGMDSLQGADTDPERALAVINRIVERSVTDSMFISMFYGRYDTKTDLFSYASAGHEPPLYYRAADDSFLELNSKGLLLGVLPNASFEQKSIRMEEGDFIAMMTDGVTECRAGETFIEQKYIIDLIRSTRHLPAQQIVENVYKHLMKLQDFELRDDFTLVVFKKTVHGFETGQAG